MESGVAETFKNGTVLVTGCTGFLGKILVEKLLRSCPVKNVAILVRRKKGFTTHQRITDMFKRGLFDRLREEKPDFIENIKIIDGNLQESSICFESTDRKWIIENVNFVFHCAATIRFNESLEIATEINVQGTDYLLSLAAEMKHLKGFVHVSTAYSHCHRNEIREQYYPVSITAKELKYELDHESKTDLLGNWPNTYTFTKAITENLILTNENDLPISIFRPSIIGCTNSEPDPGWLDNINGPSGLIVGVITGFLKIILLDINKKADVIPVDYAVNALISIMWSTVNRYKDSDQVNKTPKIYNYVSGVESPMTWATFIKEINTLYQQAPPHYSIWYNCCIYSANNWTVCMLRFFLHKVPAIIIYLCFIIRGQKSKVLKINQKVDDLAKLLRTFTMNEWKFDNRNTRKLWSVLKEEDRKTFFFSLEEFNWKSYVKIYYHGIRKHLLNEDLSNIKSALAKNRKLFWLHKIFIFLIIYGILHLSWMILKIMYS